MKISADKLFTPSILASTAVLMSMASWMIPSIGGIKKGYDIPSEWTILSFLVLFNWYTLMYISARIGELIGRKPPKEKIENTYLPKLNDKSLLVGFTLLSSIGIFATYYKIFSSMSITEAIFYISSGFANELKESLYEEYSAGVVSLRYLVVYSSALSVYSYFTTKKFSKIIGLNALLLILSAMLSSRLIFVATVLISIFIISHKIKILHIKLKNIILTFMLFFFVLSTLNYSRNSNYYESDGLYFWGGGASSILTYLGSPFQVAIGTANDISRLATEGEEAYRKLVDIDITLNTNSAFVHLHESFGYWAWLYMPTLMFFIGFAFSHMRTYGSSALLLPCGAILYASAEFWRLDLFRQGIFIVWFFFGIIYPIFIAIARYCSNDHSH